MHGTATEPSIRNIDNLLVAGHNSTVATFCAHRPTDSDALLSQAKQVQQRFPEQQLAGWPSDYEKAFKQVPGDPTQIHMVVLVQWNPVLRKLAAWIAYSQLFGGKSPPLNFARFPAWTCQVVAVLFALPMSHCVDDLICIEPENIVVSGQRT